VRFAWLAAYLAHEDPLVRASNVVALVVAANQPFYPLYIHWILGHDVVPSLLTFLSTPFFAAVPAISRWNARGGRAVLVLAGLANTVLVTKIFGQASGVGIFLLPCLLIAAAFFRPAERTLSLGLMAAGAAIFFGFDGRYGVPICRCTAADEPTLVAVHAVSAGTLVVFIGFLLSGLTGSGSPDSRNSPRRP
jgi:hypothetical protein